MKLSYVMYEFGTSVLTYSGALEKSTVKSDSYVLDVHGTANSQNLLE